VTVIVLASSLQQCSCCGKRFLLLLLERPCRSVCHSIPVFTTDTLIGGTFTASGRLSRVCDGGRPLRAISHSPRCTRLHAPYPHPFAIHNLRGGQISTGSTTAGYTGPHSIRHLPRRRRQAIPPLRRRVHPLPSCSLADAHTRSTLPLPLTTSHIRPIGYCVHLSCDLDRVGQRIQPASLICRYCLRRSRHCTKSPRPNQTSAAIQSSKRLDGLPLVSRRSSRRHSRGSKSLFFVRRTRVHVGVL